MKMREKNLAKRFGDDLTLAIGLCREAVVHEHYDDVDKYRSYATQLQPKCKKQAGKICEGLK